MKIHLKGLRREEGVSPVRKEHAEDHGKKPSDLRDRSNE